MMLNGRRIALLACGSFNPPTSLHFRMLERAKDFLELECGGQVLIGIMSPVADDFGKKDLISAAHRLELLRRGTSTSGWIRADDWECTKSEWTRTLIVLRHHREQLRKSFGDDVRLMLVCGGDVVDSFKRILPDGRNLWDPKDVETIIKEFGIIVLDREGANPDQTLNEIPNAARHLSNVFIIQDPAFPNGVSSTRLRETLKKGHSIRYCTPDLVVDYILEHKLYR